MDSPKSSQIDWEPLEDATKNELHFADVQFSQKSLLWFNMVSPLGNKIQTKESVGGKEIKIKD